MLHEPSMRHLHDLLTSLQSLAMRHHLKEKRAA
jgi:hypothetical protein